MSVIPKSGGEGAGRREVPPQGPGRGPDAREPGTRGPRRPAFKVPKVILVLLAVMLGLHLLRYALPPRAEAEVVFTLALILFDLHSPFDPARFYTLVSHAFLHANWLHIFFNGLWLLILGSRVYQSLGALRFLGFFLLTAIGGAAGQILLAWGQVAVLIGASGVVFGLLGAGAYLWVLQPADRGLERVKKVAWYCAVMMLLNFGYAAVGGMGGVERIAWEAHAGGFFTGVALFPLLRRRRPPRILETRNDV